LENAYRLFYVEEKESGILRALGKDFLSKTFSLENDGRSEEKDGGDVENESVCVEENENAF